MDGVIICSTPHGYSLYLDQKSDIAVSYTVYLDNVEINERLVESINIDKRNNTLQINLYGKEEDEDVFKEWGKTQFTKGTIIKEVKIGQNIYENYTVSHVGGSCDYIGDTARLSFQFKRRPPAS